MKWVYEDNWKIPEHFNGGNYFTKFLNGKVSLRIEHQSFEQKIIFHEPWELQLSLLLYTFDLHNVVLSNELVVFL